MRYYRNKVFFKVKLWTRFPRLSVFRNLAVIFVVHILVFNSHRNIFNIYFTFILHNTNNGHFNALTKSTKTLRNLIFSTVDTKVYFNFVLQAKVRRSSYLSHSVS